MKHIQLILLGAALLFSGVVFGQGSKIKPFSVPSFGYTWQGTHSIDFGFYPMLLLDSKKNHSNIGLLLTGNLLFYEGATYLTPVTKLRIMQHKRKKFQHLAWFASVGHSYTQIHKKYDHRITPELGVKWEFFNLSIGYNIPVTDYRNTSTNLLRVAFMYNLF